MVVTAMQHIYNHKAHPWDSHCYIYNPLWTETVIGYIVVTAMKQ